MSGGCRPVSFIMSDSRTCHDKMAAEIYAPCKVILKCIGPKGQPDLQVY